MNLLPAEIQKSILHWIYKDIPRVASVNRDLHKLVSSLGINDYLRSVQGKDLEALSGSIQGKGISPVAIGAVDRCWLDFSVALQAGFKSHLDLSDVNDRKVFLISSARLVHLCTAFASRMNNDTKASLESQFIHPCGRHHYIIADLILGFDDSMITAIKILNGIGIRAIASEDGPSDLVLEKFVRGLISVLPTVISVFVESARKMDLGILYDESSGHVSRFGSGQDLMSQWVHFVISRRQFPL